MSGLRLKPTAQKYYHTCGLHLHICPGIQIIPNCDSGAALCLQKNDSPKRLAQNGHMGPSWRGGKVERTSSLLELEFTTVTVTVTVCPLRANATRLSAFDHRSCGRAAVEPSADLNIYISVTFHAVHELSLQLLFHGHATLGSLCAPSAAHPVSCGLRTTALAAMITAGKMHRLHGSRPPNSSR